MKTIRLTEGDIKHTIKNVLYEVFGKSKNRFEPQSLMTYGDYAVLRHDSNERITNGVINSSGRQRNAYSSNSDADNYFWGSERTGRDNSNYSNIHYYCLVPKDSIYDFQANPKQYPTIKDATANEPYVSKLWNDGAVVVVSSRPTKINYIVVDGGVRPEDMGVYDSKWNMLKTWVNFSGNTKKNLMLAKRIAPFRNVEVPDFIGGYSYEELIG